MKIPTLIIGKKQIILACLTLMLAIAVYLNYTLSIPPEELQPTSVYEGNGLNYGDVIYVNSQVGEDDFFAQARIDKTASRDEAIETLEAIFSGGDLTDENKAVLTENALALSELIETETTVENLIKAAGYEDCIVYLDGESASIVVKSEDLVASQAAQIKDILLKEISVENEKIRIIPSK